MSDEHPPLIHAKRSRRATRILAIRGLLIEKGVVTADELDDIIVRARARTPADGAKVVARAWLDAAFRERLLTDARTAVGDLGYQLSHDAELAVVENTPMFTIWSSVPCAPAIRHRCWVRRRSGTRASPTVSAR